MVERHHLVTFNIGNLYKNYGNDKQIFRRVALDDPAYLQREVLVNLDGSIRDEFENMISSVGITLRKKHQNGEETVKEIFVNKELLKEYSGKSKLIYLNKEDINRTEWLNYDFLVNWQFKKDGNYITDWMPSNSPVINLYTPYQYRRIDLMGDLKELNEDGVLVVAVEIEYLFFGKIKKERVTIKTSQADDDYQLDAILPLGTDKVKYKITWIYREGKKVELESEDEHGVILIDEIPLEKRS
jgi:hypothetical protein